ncbi:MED7 Mediator of RNA polymerase II transcription subunit 7 [Candida maltosa Xu316]
MSNTSEDLISSLYPPPPPYYKFFTEENIQKLATWQSEKPTTTTTTNTEDAEEQVPPDPPPGTQYRGYGNIWLFEDKLPSLKDSQWKQLYVDDDENITSETKIKELHKLMDSLLLNFLELIGILSVDPSKFDPKIQDINLILININHLLNTYRPHQSRESLIMLLKRQIAHKRSEIENIDKVCNDIKEKIKGLVNQEIPDSEVVHTKAQKIDEKDQIKQDIINKLLQSV